VIDRLPQILVETDILDTDEWRTVVSNACAIPPLVERFGFDEHSARIAPVEPARTFVNFLLLPTWNGRAQDAVAFDEDAFNATFLDFRGLVTANLARFMFVTPMVLLELETSPMEIADGLALARLNDVDVIRLLHNGYLPNQRGVYSTQFASVALYRELVQSLESPIQLGWDEADSLADVLHIVAGGAARPLGTQMNSSPGGDFDAAGPDVAFSHFESFLQQRNKTYLATGDLESLRSGWKVVNSGQRPSLRLSAARLRSGAQRADARDAIVDLMISAEAFFNKSENTPGEQTFRIALRAAHFLATSLAERQQIYDEFYAAYVTRNKIVHGTESRKPPTISGASVPLDELAKRITQHMRRALKKSYSMPEFETVDPNAAYWNKMLLEAGIPETAESAEEPPPESQ